MIRRNVVICGYLLMFASAAWLTAFTQEEIEEYEQQSYELLNNDRALDAVYDGDLEKLRSGFSDLNLAVLDSRELRILRNMYFAQYGYTFKSEDLREWFDQFPWYEPLSENVNDRLTIGDSINIAKIKHFESAHSINDNISVDKDDIIGIWHGSPIVAAGYNDLVYFYPDMTFKYALNQMDWSQRLTGMSGTWRLEFNRLVLAVDTKYIISGGEIVEPYASCASEFAIEGGEGIATDVTPAEELFFPISKIIVDDTGDFPDYIPHMKIGYFDWWLLSSDPEQELR